MNSSFGNLLRLCKHVMRWFWNVTGLDSKEIVVICLMLGLPTMDFAAPLIHWKCLSNCNIFYLNILSFLFWLDNSFEFHYSKNGEEYIVGQEHLYEDPCDEWLDLVNNKLTSPNFPKAYDPLTDCKWNLTAPQEHYVTLVFEFIDVSKKQISYCMHSVLFFIFNS